MNRPLIHWLAVLALVSACGDDGSQDPQTTGTAGSTTNSDLGTTTDAVASRTGDSTDGPGDSTGEPDGGSDEADGSTGDPDPDPEFTEEEWAALQQLSPDTLPLPPADVTNNYSDDPAAAALGQALFFTTIFSGRLLDGDNNGVGGSLGEKGETGKVSCASCHLPEDAFTDTRSPSQQISLGSGWTRRRSPSLLDVGQAKLIMWDGRRDALFNQVFGPIESLVEMNSSRLFVAQQIFAEFKDEYEAVFGPMPPMDDTERFPPVSAESTGCTPAGQTPLDYCDGDIHGYPGDGAQYDSMSPSDQDAVTRVVANMGKAVAAYERKLACGSSRFDVWMHGDDEAMSRSEQRGAQVFVGPGNCDSCHSGPYMSDQAFHNVGLAPGIVASAFIDSDDPGALIGLQAALEDPLNSHGIYSDGDDGRLPASVAAELEGSFRTPTLRCVAQRPSFFHTGQALGLPPVVEFFNKGGDIGGFLGSSELVPLGLSQRERADLVAFLRALNGPGPSPELLDPEGP